jgi:hypothetical protein
MKLTNIIIYLYDYYRSHFGSKMNLIEVLFFKLSGESIYTKKIFSENITIKEIKEGLDSPNNTSIELTYNNNRISANTILKDLGSNKINFQIIFVPSIIFGLRYIYDECYLTEIISINNNNIIKSFNAASSTIYAVDGHILISANTSDKELVAIDIYTDKVIYKLTESDFRNPELMQIFYTCSLKVYDDYIFISIEELGVYVYNKQTNTINHIIDDYREITIISFVDSELLVYDIDYIYKYNTETNERKNLFNIYEFCIIKLDVSFDNNLIAINYEMIRFELVELIIYNISENKIIKIDKLDSAIGINQLLWMPNNYLLVIYTDKILIFNPEYCHVGTINTINDEPIQCNNILLKHDTYLIIPTNCYNIYVIDIIAYLNNMQSELNILYKHTFKSGSIELFS